MKCVVATKCLVCNKVEMSDFYRSLWYNPACGNSINANVYVEVGLKSCSDYRGLSEMEFRGGKYVVFSGAESSTLI